MQHVTGIGGVFLRGRNADSLRSWYAENLGVDIDVRFGGRTFTDGGPVTWAVFPSDSEYLGRPDQIFMINYRVDDLDGMLAQLRRSGAEVADQTEETPDGKFGWAADPEGNRFELWQPPPR